MLVFSQLAYWLSVFYCCRVVSKLYFSDPAYSLGRISVAMVTVFKNFTTISIALGDRIFFDNPISLPIVGALGVMVCLVFDPGLDGVSNC